MSHRYDRPWSWNVWLEFVGTMAMAALVCLILWLTVGCVVPVQPHPPQPMPAPAVWVFDVSTDPPADCVFTVEGDPASPRPTDPTGFLFINTLPKVLKSGVLQAVCPGFDPFVEQEDWQAFETTVHNVITLTRTVPPFPQPPSKRELMEAKYTFQGLRANCPQYDPRPIPIFDPMLDVVDDACKQAILDAHRAAGDTVIGVALSHQYSEPGVLPVLQWGHDWTTDLPGLHAYLLDLIQRGFYIQLHLAGDGHSVKDAAGRYVYNDPVGHTYGCEWLNATWPTIADALDDIHRYIRFVHGYDGSFYGCETPTGDVIEVPKFARQFKARWPDGVVGIEFNVGHLPFGEGDADWQPNGRMRDFDMVFAEFDPDTLDQDSTWQIVARLMKQKGDYHRPPEQPAGDDPNPPAYLGKWPGVAVCFEWDTYYDVRFKTTPASVAAKRAKLRAMGCPFTG